MLSVLDATITDPVLYISHNSLIVVSSKKSSSKYTSVNISSVSFFTEYKVTFILLSSGVTFITECLPSFS